jgi:hypothetical protein
VLQSSRGFRPGQYGGFGLGHCNRHFRRIAFHQTIPKRGFIDLTPRDSAMGPGWRSGGWQAMVITGLEYKHASRMKATES